MGKVKVIHNFTYCFFSLGSLLGRASKWGEFPDDEEGQPNEDPEGNGNVNQAGIVGVAEDEDEEEDIKGPY